MVNIHRIIFTIPKTDTIWAAFARVNAVLTSLAFVFIYINVIGKSEAGSLYLWLGVVNIAAAIGGLGRAQFAYSVPANAFRSGEISIIANFIINSIVWVGACTTLFTWLCMQFVPDALDDAPSMHIVLLSILTAILTLLIEVLRILKRFGSAAMFNPGTCYFVLCIITLTLNRNLIEPKSMLLYLVIVHACLVALALGTVWQTLGGWEKLTSYQLKILAIDLPLPKYIWPYWLNTIPVVILYQMDIVIVGLYFGPEMLAVYTMASRLAGGISFVNSLAYAILPSRISDLISRDHSTYIGREVRKFAIGLSFISLFVILLLLIGIYFGLLKHVSSEALEGFILLAFAHSVNCFLGARSVVLQLTGNGHIQASISWIFASICCILLLMAALYGNFLLVFMAVTISIIGQALTESWLLRWKLGISSVPGIPDRTPA